MKRMFMVASSLVLMAIPVCGVAQSSCLPNHLAAQTLIHVAPGKSASLTLPLQDQNANGDFTTKVQVDVAITPGGVSLSAHFDDAFQGVSLPYNLYAILIMRDGQPVEWLDFTHVCGGPGIGFFPGHHVNLPEVKLKSPEGGTFQIMIWGRL